MPVSDQSRWILQLTDMNGNTPSLAGPVLSASQKQYSHHLNAGKTMQFTVNIDNPAASFVLNNDALLKVYRRQRWAPTNVQLLMVGDVIHAEESAQGDVGLLTVVAADPWWRWQRRLLGMAVDGIGRGIGWGLGNATTLFDYSFIADWLITSLNEYFYTGVDIGIVQNCGTSAYIGPVYAQNAGDMLQQICNVLGGPEFEIVPVEPSGLMPRTHIATVNILQRLGVSQHNTVFEYGAGSRNVATYDRLLSKDGQCNVAYSPPSGFPDVTANGDTMVFAADGVSAYQLGLYEDVAQGDMASIPLRQALCNEMVQVRSRARQQITFTPTVDCPLDYTANYNVGDTVTARAWVGGYPRYNGQVRVYGVDISVDDNDAETPALTLIPGSS